MTDASRSRLQQRADYTYKQNAMSGRHGWLRLTPAYSLKIVQEIFASVDASTPQTVLDPFCGTATTALAASNLGHCAITMDINPFLKWLAHVKTATYGTATIDAVRSLGKEVVGKAQTSNAFRAEPPPMHGIDRWWGVQELDLLCRLKAAILHSCPTPGQHRDLLNVALCRTLIAASNVRFNHQSLSLGKSTSRQLELFSQKTDEDTFLNQLDWILLGAAENPNGQAIVIQADARNMTDLDIPCADLLITSPPYANRMSYIRELRPHMYWLDYLVSGRQAGEMDWDTIGGTWGVATSRLLEWAPPKDTFESETLISAVTQIASEHNPNGRILANYVLKYFTDMWQHLRSVTKWLNLGADVHYIVGNSSFYGVLVPVEQIYREMLNSLGFSRVSCTPIRKRNSNKKLFEFDVRGSWDNTGVLGSKNR